VAAAAAAPADVMSCSHDPAVADAWTSHHEVLVSELTEEETSGLIVVTA